MSNSNARPGDDDFLERLRERLPDRRPERGRSGEAVPEKSSGGDFVEVVQQLCDAVFERLPAGADISIDLDERVLMARRDASGVLISIREGGANRSMLRSAMQQIEVSNSMGPVATFSEAPGVSQTPRSANHQTSRSVEDPQPAEDDLGFEIVFDEPDAAQSSLEASEAPPATWGAVADYVGRAIELTSSELGRTVASNYWRQALRAAQLWEELEVDFGGAVSAPAPDLPIGDDVAERMERAFSAWRERAGRVLSADEEIDALVGPPPWRQG